MNSAVDIVVLGASPTGLYAVREAAKMGMSVALADTAAGCASASRHVRGEGRCFIGDLPSIDVWLQQIPSRGGAPPLLLPTNDLFIEYIYGAAERLSASFLFAECYANVASRLLDKSRFHRLCVGSGMATPGVWSAGEPSHLLMFKDEIAFPCILKPQLIHLAKKFLAGKKVLLLETKEEFLRAVDSIPGDTGGWLVQEMIPGPESEITLFAGYRDRRGRLRQAFTGRKLRQYPPGFGSASLVSSEPCKETLELTEAFLDRIDFKGICGAEYKRDPRDGKLKIIEINPRPTLWFQLTHDAGVRIVEAAVADLVLQQEVRQVPHSGEVVWRYGLKDAASTLFYQRNKGRFVFPPPDVSSARNAGKRSWPVFSLDDIMPSLHEPVGYVRKAIGRLA